MSPKTPPTSVKRVAVTGGAGFIGSHLVDQLVEAGKEVVVIDDFSSGSRENLKAHYKNPVVKILEGDVRHLPSLERAFREVDIVYHLATHCVRLSLTEPQVNHEINATGTLNALLAAKSCGVRRFVYCSSSEVYGNAEAKLGGILREDSPKLPTTIYGSSKLVGEHYTLSFHQTYGLPTLIVRPFNAYGPRSHFAGAYGEVIPRFAILAKAGLAPLIFGDGSQTRDFTYVQDTARGILEAGYCDRLLGDSINLARGREVSIKDLAMVILRLTRARVQPRFVGERPGDIVSLGCDTTKSKAILPHVPLISLDEGLRKYLAWLDTQKLDYAALAREMTEKNWISADKSHKDGARKAA